MVKKKKKKKKKRKEKFFSVTLPSVLFHTNCELCGCRCESRKQFGLISNHPANNTTLSFWGSIMHIYWQLNTNFSTFCGSEQMRKKKKQMK